MTYATVMKGRMISEPILVTGGVGFIGSNFVLHWEEAVISEKDRLASALRVAEVFS
jgi:dTDP-D-glucose 4,6-dehydratase